MFAMTLIDYISQLRVCVASLGLEGQQWPMV